MGQELIKYYRVLNIDAGATPEEIEEAFIRAKAAYSRETVGTYSLFSQGQREEMLEKITEAYEKLTDPDTVLGYDNGHTSNGDGEDGLVEAAPEVPDITHEIKLSQQLAVMDHSSPVAAEQYRILFTKLEDLYVKNSYKTLAITSTVKGEGKTITSLNLSYVMANEFKKKVVLVECDLKNTSITNEHLDTKVGCGLVDVLKGDADLSESVLRLQCGLHLLPAGKAVRNSSELLGSRRMRDVLNRLKSEYDFVILDCPPILPLADINILSGLVDGFLLVVRSGKTRQDLVRKAVGSASNCNFVGTVLNNVEPTLKKYHY